MKLILGSVVACFLFLGYANGQSVETAAPHHATQAATPAANSQRDSDDMEQMRADLERLKILLNQMRTNLAFVQTSQTPLKHQFELETDAWQVVVEQMERRLKEMEDRKSREIGPLETGAAIRVNGNSKRNNNRNNNRKTQPQPQPQQTATARATAKSTATDKSVRSTPCIDALRSGT